jgi:hypothetical protein
MTGSTLQTPCLIILCEQIPGNLIEIFNGAELEKYEADRNFFPAQPEINRLNSLSGTYDKKHYGHALIIRKYSESQLLLARLNANLGAVFVIENTAKLDLLDSLFDCGDTDSICREKLDDCVRYVRNLQSELTQAFDDDLQAHSNKLIEKLENLKADFDVYHDPLRKVFNSLKV